MRKFGWLAVLCFAAVSGLAAASAQAADDPKKCSLHRFQSLTLGGVQFRNTEMKVMTDRMTRAMRDRAPRESNPMNETVETPLVVGLSHLAKLRVYIAYGEQMVYFSAANAN